MQRHSIVGDGVTSGVIGATAVAIWFLIVDSFAARPLYTPRVLGAALFTVLGPIGGEGAAVHIIAYTIFHYAVFILIGIIVSVIIHRAEREPTVLAGLLILFVIFELGFYGYTALLARALPLGALAWYQVAAGNLIAAASMGAYLWHENPGLGHEFADALDGRDHTAGRP